MDRLEAEMGRVREESQKRREEKIKKIKEEKVRQSDKVTKKVAKHSVFPMICGSGGSKIRLAKAARAEPSGQMGDEHLHAVVTQHIWKSKCAKPCMRNGLCTEQNVRVS